MDLRNGREKSHFPLKGKGQVAGVHLGYCIAYGYETEGPFFKDKCAIVEIELAEPAWGTNSPFIKTKENLPELLHSTQLD